MTDHINGIKMAVAAIAGALTGTGGVAGVGPAHGGARLLQHRGQSDVQRAALCLEDQRERVGPEAYPQGWKAV